MYLTPLAIFPLVINAAVYGGWWAGCSSPIATTGTDSGTNIRKVHHRWGWFTGAAVAMESGGGCMTQSLVDPTHRALAAF